jgi:hypothetical protein
MNPTRRSFLTRIFAGAVAAPALTRIIAESTKRESEVSITIPSGTFVWKDADGALRYNGETTIIGYDPIDFRDIDLSMLKLK